MRNIKKKTVKFFLYKKFLEAFPKPMLLRHSLTKSFMNSYYVFYSSDNINLLLGHPLTKSFMNSNYVCYSGNNNNISLLVHHKFMFYVFFFLIKFP